MFVPVTTKPYLNSVNFSVLQQGIPAFFLSIKEKLINILLPAKAGLTGVTPSALRDNSTDKFQCIVVSEDWITDPTSLPTTLAGLFFLRFELHLIRSQRKSRSLRFGDNSTNASNPWCPSGYSIRSFLASLIKEDFYNGKSSGI
jgi:hypothetical protein